MVNEIDVIIQKGKVAIKKCELSAYIESAEIDICCMEGTITDKAYDKLVDKIKAIFEKIRAMIDDISKKLTIVYLSSSAQKSMEALKESGGSVELTVNYDVILDLNRTYIMKLKESYIKIKNGYMTEYDLSSMIDDFNDTIDSYRNKEVTISVSRASKVITDAVKYCNTLNSLCKASEKQALNMIKSCTDDPDGNKKKQMYMKVSNTLSTVFNDYLKTMSLYFNEILSYAKNKDN